MIHRLSLIFSILILQGVIVTATAQKPDTLLLSGRWDLAYFTTQNHLGETNLRLVAADSFQHAPKRLEVASGTITKVDHKNNLTTGTWKIETEGAKLLYCRYKRKKEVYIIEKLDNDELVLKTRLRVSRDSSASLHLFYKKRNEQGEPVKNGKELMLPGQWTTCRAIERVAEIDTLMLEREKACFESCALSIWFMHHHLSADTYNASRICERSMQAVPDFAGRWTVDEETNTLFLKNAAGVVFKFSLLQDHDDTILLQKQ